MNALAPKGLLPHGPLAQGSPRPPRARGTLDNVLIEAAMDLFAAYGYRGTSLAKIARAAGVTKGALYWHFTDKEDFFIAVAEKVLAEWGKSIYGGSSATSKAEYADEFLEVFAKTAALNQTNPWVTRLLLIVSLESHKIGPRVLRMIRKQNLRGFTHYEVLIQRGIDLGAFDSKLDVKWAATQIYSTYLGLANLWYLHGERFNLRRSLERQARAFLKQWSERA